MDRRIVANDFQLPDFKVKPHLKIHHQGHQFLRRMEKMTTSVIAGREKQRDESILLGREHHRDQREELNIENCQNNFIECHFTTITLTTLVP